MYIYLLPAHYIIQAFYGITNSYSIKLKGLAEESANPKLNQTDSAVIAFMNGLIYFNCIHYYLPII